MVSQDEREIEKILKQFDPQMVKRIRSIIYTNMVGGRIATYMMNDDHTLEQYIQTIANNYRTSSNYLYQLQVCRSEACWQPLLETIHHWVFALFMRKGLSKSEAVDLIQETAENTALKILITLFPYDVSFDVWAFCLTQTQCCQTLSKLRGNSTGS